MIASKSAPSASSARAIAPGACARSARRTRSRTLRSPLPQFYWLWAPLNFDDAVFLYDVNQDESGEAWHQSAFLGGVGDVDAEAMASSSSRVVFKPRDETREERGRCGFARKSGSEVEIAARAIVPFFDVRYRLLSPRVGSRRLHGRGPHRLRRVRARFGRRDVSRSTSTSRPFAVRACAKTAERKTESACSSS